MRRANAAASLRGYVAYSHELAAPERTTTAAEGESASS